MARMHSGAKGKHGSKRPLVKKRPPWLRYSSKEIELLITKLAKEGYTTDKIGLILRDTYGIPSVKTAVGKSISKILKEKELKSQIPPELANLISKARKIKKHLETNKQDNVSKRGLTLTISKINRLAKYFKRIEVLPKDWKVEI